MNSHPPSNANKQSSKGGNELAKSSSRAVSVDRADPDKTPAPGDAVQQGAAAGNAQSGAHAGAQADAQTNDDSKNVAADAPSSPGGQRLAADQKMDDDSGLSNTANRTSSELDRNARQERQSNVGRRSDGTPD